jgi:hypothetical protein
MAKLCQIISTLICGVFLNSLHADRDTLPHATRILTPLKKSHGWVEMTVYQLTAVCQLLYFPPTPLTYVSQPIELLAVEGHH